MKTRQVALTLSLTAVLGAGALSLWTTSGWANAQEDETQRETQVSQQAVEVVPSDALTQDELNTIEVVQNYGPSVVAVNVAVRGQPFDPFSDFPFDPRQLPPEFRRFFEQFRLPDQEPRVREGSGSGFVVTEAGRIVTNYHVIEGAVDLSSTSDEQGIGLVEGGSVTVSFQEDPEAELPVRVVGINTDYDLALLELENPDDLPEGVQPIPIANSDAVQVGQKVIAIGNPLGFSFTVTTGIVSAIEREVTGFGGIDIPYIQTDAAINRGNSGGPLLNSSGELIGVNNAIITPSGAFAGIGLAVPSNLLSESLAALEEGGLGGFIGQLENPNRPVVGITSQVSVSEYPEELRGSINLPEDGAVITSVAPGSPAAEAGLQAAQFAVTAAGRTWPVGGDIITAVDGQAVSTIRDLQNIVFERQPGDTVELTLWRDGQERQVEVTLVAARELTPSGQEE
jgi:serine protease Do